MSDKAAMKEFSLSMTDRILKFDRQQALSEPFAVKCKDASHGKLQVTRSGFVLACGVCGYAVPATLKED